MALAASEVVRLLSRMDEDEEPSRAQGLACFSRRRAWISFRSQACVSGGRALDSCAGGLLDSCWLLEIVVTGACAALFGSRRRSGLNNYMCQAA